MKSKIALLVASTFIIAAALQAGPKHHLGQKAQHDTNKDGALSLDEVKAGKIGHLVKNFTAIDVDQSGTITGEEIFTFWENKKAAAAAK